MIYPQPPKETTGKGGKEDKKRSKSKEKDKAKNAKAPDNGKTDEKGDSDTTNRNSVISDNKSIGGESKGSVEAELGAIKKEDKENTHVQEPNQSLYPSLN